MAAKGRGFTIRVDEEVYTALVKQKVGMTSLSDIVRHCLEACGYLDKREDDPFWYQSRLLEMPVKQKQTKGKR
jgi:hypothetical protein